MNHVIAPLMIDTAPNDLRPDARSPSAEREHRRAQNRFLDAHASLGARIVYRLVCALSGERA